MIYNAYTFRLPVLLLSVFAVIAAARAQNTWDLVSPNLPNESMECVRGASSGLVLAVGSSGVVLRSNDSGATWNWSHTGVTKWLYAVAISVTEKCLAVGEAGTILVSTDRGLSWTQRNSPATGTFLAVEWLTDNIAIAAGQAGVMVKTTDAGVSWSVLSTGITWQIESMQFLTNSVGYACGAGFVYRTSDAGVTWAQHSVSPTDAAQTNIRFTSTRTGFMISSQGGIWRTIDGAITWARIGTLSIFCTGISCVDSTTAIIVGRDAIYRMTGSGSTLTLVDSAYGRGLLDVSFVSPAVGFSVGINGRILRSTDAGLTWRSARQEIQANLTDVSFWSESEGVVVGTDKYAYYTLDSGRTWTAKPTPTIFNAICHIDALHGVATRSEPGDYSQGTYSTIWRTSDGGASWGLMASSSDFITTFRGVAFWNSMQGCVIGDYYHFNGHFGITPYYTFDGGISWSKAAIGSLNQNSYPYMTSLSIVDSLTGYAFYFASGTRALLRTTDAGQSWTGVGTTSLPQVSGVHFTSRMIGTMIDNGGNIRRTENGGATWLVQDSTGIGSLSSICFGTSTLGAVVGTGGTIKSTVDGGKHWQNAPTLTSLPLSKVYVSSAGNVIAIGSAGTIIRGQIRSGPVIPPRPQGPISFSLVQNYPNPFNGGTRIPFSVDQSGLVSVRVYDLLGREVATVVHEELDPGSYERPFDGTNLPSGVYVVRLQSGGNMATGKMVHVK